MNSSQMALVVSAVSIMVSALVLTTAQRRVLERRGPRREPYLVAWLVTLAVLGGLRSASDYMVGNASLGRVLFHFAWIAAAVAFSLFVGHRLVGGAPRMLPLFLVHTIVMALVSYI